MVYYRSCEPQLFVSYLNVHGEWRWSERREMACVKWG